MTTTVLKRLTDVSNFDFFIAQHVSSAATATPSLTSAQPPLFYLNRASCQPIRLLVSSGGGRGVVPGIVCHDKSVK